MGRTSSTTATSFGRPARIRSGGKQGFAAVKTFGNFCYSRPINGSPLNGGKSGSHKTHRWRERDSNPRSGEPPPGRARLGAGWLISREGPRVCRLAAGGRRIRTLGPPCDRVRRHHSRCCRWRRPGSRCIAHHNIDPLERPVEPGLTVPLRRGSQFRGAAAATSTGVGR